MIESLQIAIAAGAAVAGAFTAGFGVYKWQQWKHHQALTELWRQHNEVRGEVAGLKTDIGRVEATAASKEALNDSLARLEQLLREGIEGLRQDVREGHRRIDEWIMHHSGSRGPRSGS